MINDDKYKIVLETGLLLDHYYLLVNIKNKVKLVNTKRIQGFINLLTKKGYLQDEQLTEKGHELISDYVAAKIVPTNLPIDSTTTTTTEVESPPILSFTNWYKQLHAKCKTKLIQETGKSQYYLMVQGKPYSYLPGIRDLGVRIEKFMRTYKLTDLEKIETCILKHCGVRNQRLVYYIMREKPDSKSDLAADYENINDVDEPTKKDNVDPKTLF